MKEHSGYRYLVQHRFAGHPLVNFAGGYTEFKPGDIIEVEGYDGKSLVVRVFREGKTLDPYKYAALGAKLETHCRVEVAATMESLYEKKRAAQ